MIIPFLPVIVCVVGLLVYALSNNATPNSAKVQELGRIAFFAGLLAYLLGGAK